MRTIYQYVRPKLPRMGLIFSIKTFGTIIELFLPWLLSSIIDDCAAVGGVRGAWLRGGLMLLCALGALFLPDPPVWLGERTWLLYLAGNLIFVLYDVGLSRLIALVMARMPGRRR